MCVCVCVCVRARASPRNHVWLWTCADLQGHPSCAARAPWRQAARRDGADAARECADRAGALVREGDAYTEQSRAMVAALVEDADALHTDGGGGGGGGGAGGDDMEL